MPSLLLGGQYYGQQYPYWTPQPPPPLYASQHLLPPPHGINDRHRGYVQTPTGMSYPRDSDAGSVGSADINQIPSVFPRRRQQHQPCSAFKSVSSEHKVTSLAPQKEKLQHASEHNVLEISTTKGTSPIALTNTTTAQEHHHASSAYKYPPRHNTSATSSSYSHLHPPQSTPMPTPPAYTYPYLHNHPHYGHHYYGMYYRAPSSREHRGQEHQLPHYYFNSTSIAEYNVNSHEALKLCSNDIIISSIKDFKSHPGNIRFQSIVRRHRDAFVACNNNDGRSFVIQCVLNRLYKDGISEVNPAPRFLKSIANKWEEVFEVDLLHENIEYALRTTINVAKNREDKQDGEKRAKKSAPRNRAAAPSKKRKSSSSTCSLEETCGLKKVQFCSKSANANSEGDSRHSQSKPDSESKVGIGTVQKCSIGDAPNGAFSKVSAHSLGNQTLPSSFPSPQILFTGGGEELPPPPTSI